jgi:tetratricopeptide (TPR) repeat protein
MPQPVCAAGHYNRVDNDDYAEALRVVSRIHGWWGRGRRGPRLFLLALWFAPGSPVALPNYAQTGLSAPSPTVAGAGIEDIRQLVSAGEYAKSETALRAFLDHNKTSADAEFLLAYTLFRLNRPAESLTEYTKAAQLRPPSAEDLRSVAQDYVLLDDYADADKWMVRSLAMNHSDAEAWYALGRIRFSLQRFQDAVDCFQKSLALVPGSVKAENNLGLAYEGLNRTDDAVKAYRLALEWQQASKHPSEQPMLNLSILLIHRGQLDEALPLLTQAATIAPRDPRIHEQLGHLYLQEGQLPNAQHEFEAAVALAPGSGADHFLLGQAYSRQGLSRQAQSEFARAAVLNGAHSNTEQK